MLCKSGNLSYHFLSKFKSFLQPTVRRRLHITTNSLSTMAKRILIGENDFSEQIQKATESLLNGCIIAVPTDTIYGIAGLAQNSEAVKQIYNIKRRNPNQPVAISVGNIDDIYRWSQVLVPKTLLEELLPGPVTVVMERSADLNPDLNPSTSLIGIRIPDHQFMIDLARSCGEPIALTSANISASRSTLSVEEFQNLWPRLDIICDGGTLGDTDFSRRGSTVVDLSVQGSYKIIRDGSAQKETVAALHRYGLKERT